MSDSPVTRHPHAAAREYDGEAFIVVPELGEYNILNGTGSRIWELIDGSRGVTQIAEVISEEFEVSLEAAEKDVTEFVEDLKKHQIVS